MLIDLFLNQQVNFVTYRILEALVFLMAIACSYVCAERDEKMGKNGLYAYGEYLHAEHIVKIYSIILAAFILLLLIFTFMNIFISIDGSFIPKNSILGIIVSKLF